MTGKFEGITGLASVTSGWTLSACARVQTAVKSSRGVNSWACAADGSTTASKTSRAINAPAILCVARGDSIRAFLFLSRAQSGSGRPGSRYAAARDAAVSAGEAEKSAARRLPRSEWFLQVEFRAKAGKLRRR